MNSFFDAFNITVHRRRPIPSRTDTIGPWLDTLSFLTWLAALTNSALVYLFCSSTSSARAQGYCNVGTAAPSTLDKVHQHIISAASVTGSVQGDPPHAGDGGAARELPVMAPLIALAASHACVQHVMEQALWHASEDVRTAERGVHPRIQHLPAVHPAPINADDRQYSRGSAVSCGGSGNERDEG
ncbi:hypothetical protein B0H12DRAFT_491120 [Mycena haematopus]|nr:hypothetical protein B0H12DRAFT_491120 [Mycena haematopus]